MIKVRLLAISTSNSKMRRITLQKTHAFCSTMSLTAQLSTFYSSRKTKTLLKPF